MSDQSEIQEWPAVRGLTRVCCLCTAAAIFALFCHLKGATCNRRELLSQPPTQYALINIYMQTPSLEAYLTLMERTVFSSSYPQQPPHALYRTDWRAKMLLW